MLEAVQACNIQCRYCYSAGTDRHVIPLDVFRMALRKIVDYADQNDFDKLDLVWQGGEPLLAGLAFFRSAQRCLTEIGGPLHIRQFLQTNGLLLDDAWCRLLLEHDVQVGLSLDGPQPLHDAFRCDDRGGGTHSRVVQAFHRATNHGLRVGFNAVVTPQSMPCAADIYAFFNQLGCGLRVNPLLPAGRAASMFPSLCFKGEYGRFLCELFDIWTTTPTNRVRVSPLDGFLKSLRAGFSNECQFLPTCAGAFLAIRSDGTAFICSRFNSHPLGNICQATVPTLFSQPIVRRLKTRADGLAQCQACENWHLCYGGCPYSALLVRGSVDQRDPFCQDYWRIYTHLRMALSAPAPGEPL
jgi:uncharacterized protein